MELTDFRTYHRWRAEEFLRFLAGHGFQIVEQATLGGRLGPLSYAAARRALDSVAEGTSAPAG